ncbi:MAG: exodeoxyribonuclease VII large subunit [Atopobiaceae bacterium]|jgi:exodeoxyribonuclease VII large subunit|nr:exodeoxyribonuclease VII large subunit [Atopobiaceae bacterium]MCH4180121.1 exodeoxyribonuclease VII large subunit [Atopobiaceae bacterium]MCH4213827.1 exodeoxyribonuclease VII large subunit [Atopobiaceae bacterium]MCH4229929.1 exodeoxyribonuclease VII large subunit [Atopobiaceae bacterium]MCH4275710.1 exodeoxyribonuclease VII large subunit [Atopobiaceae bacterium]
MAWSKQDEQGERGAHGPQALSVSEAVATAKGAVAGLGTFVVMGEVTGFRGPNARSGHCYFQVKDDSSSMDCIVWRGVAAHMGFELRDGLKIQVTGAFDVYAGSGRLSFVAKHVEVAGEGLLRQQVAELARRLEREGLMDQGRKRAIPRFCTRVGVVTSLSGSVIEDVKRTLARRNPLVELEVAGCSVQGPGAAASVEQALAVAEATAPDCILLVRGGGSFEDLMTFNDEGLARAVARCAVPVVCGIGHEPDVSICDMVCDRRCSTPTAAAESVAPALDEVEAAIADRSGRLVSALQGLCQRDVLKVEASADALTRAMDARLTRERATVDAFATHRCLSDPAFVLEGRENDLLALEQRLHDAIPRSMARRAAEVDAAGRRLTSLGSRLLDPYEATLARSAATLEALSPLRVLGRGYAIARDARGHVLSHADPSLVGQDVTVMLGDGTLTANVTAADAGGDPSK